MFNLVKKDFLTLSKNKNDLLELLLMPFILTMILGFALGNLLLGSLDLEPFNIGIVDSQNFESELIALETTLEEEGLPPEAIQQITAGLEGNDPAGILLEMIAHEDFQAAMVSEKYATIEAAEAALEAEEIEGYIHIPAGFTYEYWQAVYLAETSEATLDVKVLSDELVSGTILRSVVDSFVEEYNLVASVAIATQGQATIEENREDLGEVTYLSVENPINAFQYYTVGMGVMFALFTAPTLASRAFREKQQHVFSRIMLAGTSPFTYLGSKMISGTLISFIQLLILFVFSTLLFDSFGGRDFDFWLDIIYTTGLYAIFVGSLSSLLTSTTLYANDLTTANFFGAFNSVFAFLGGSFIPVDQFSDFLAEIGNWIPNGTTMTAYLQILQGFSFHEVLPLLTRVLVISVVLLVVAVAVFPKRRLD